MKRADFVASFNEISDDGHSGNSQAVPEDHYKENHNLAEQNEKFQHLPEKQTHSRNHKARAGFFSRLRRKLGLRSEELPDPRSGSSVRATRIGDVEVIGGGLITVQKTRTPYCTCVPTPPGCIPTEVILKAEIEKEELNSAPLNRSGLGKKPTVIDKGDHPREGTRHGRRNENRNIQENAVLPSNAQNCQDSKPIKVLYNNWMDPEL